ncbi:MAG: hypothetical protein ABIL09_07690, partial [Gemmatimonadota bacterium]
AAHHEAHELPGDESAWGLCNLDNEVLVVSTSPLCLYFVFDLRTRTWVGPGAKSDTETLVWNLSRGSDGTVYGGSYPGCALLRFDPATHDLANLGRMSDVPENLYLRYVEGGLPGWLILVCGDVLYHCVAYSLETGERVGFGRSVAGARMEVRHAAADGSFVCIEYAPGDWSFYRPGDFAEVTGAGEVAALRARVPVLSPMFAGMRPPADVHLAPARFSRQRTCALKGFQEWALHCGDTDVMEVHPIPTEPAVGGFHYLSAMQDGRVLGVASFGQTVFIYDPRTGAVHNSRDVTDWGGEIYAALEIGGRIFMAAYTGGESIVYDPAQPWRKGVNPRTIGEPLYPLLIRPNGMSAVGPDGSFWTGWSTDYGKYGGGITRADVRAETLEYWYDPFPEQAIAGIAADDRYVYFTTDGYASGRQRQDGTFHFAAIDPRGCIVHDHVFPHGVRPGKLCRCREWIAVLVDRKLAFFDTRTMDFGGAEVEIGAYQYRSSHFTVTDQALYAVLDGTAYRVDVRAREVRPAKLPGGLTCAAYNPADGYLYFGLGTQLCRAREAQV